MGISCLCAYYTIIYQRVRQRVSILMNASGYAVKCEMTILIQLLISSRVTHVKIVTESLTLG